MRTQPKLRDPRVIGALVIVLALLSVGALALLAHPHPAARRHAVTHPSSPSAALTATAPPSGGTAVRQCLQRRGGSIYPIAAVLDSCGYPSPDTTGVPSGVGLRTVSAGCGCLPANAVWSHGELAITGPTTISGLDIPGPVLIVSSDFPDLRHTPITIVDSRIQASGDSGGNVVDLQGAGGVLIAHSFIAGTENESGTRCISPAGSDVGNNGPGDVLDYDWLACAGEPINGSGWTALHSYVIVDGYPPGSHIEDWYIPGGGTASAEYDTLVQPYDQTAGIFGDAKFGALSGITIEHDLIAGNQNNGGLALGCTSLGRNDGKGPNTGVLVAYDRFSSAYDTNRAWPFAQGNTDGGPGTTWTDNYMDRTGRTVSQPVHAC